MSKALEYLNQALGEGEVVDADTVRIDGEPARITGMDAPELPHGRQSYEPGANTAIDYLNQVLGETEFRDTGERDRYGRKLVEGRHNGQDLSDEMIRAGVAYPMMNEIDEGNKAQAYLQSFLRRANPNARTEWDERMDAERRIAPFRTDFDVLEDQSIEPESTGSKALDRGIANLKASLGASMNFLGEKLGSDTLADWGEEVAARNLVEAALNPRTVESWEDADGLAEIGTWAVEVFTENLPNLALMAGGSLAGMAAGGLTRMAAAGIGKTLVRAASKAALKKSMARWATAGATAAVYPQHMGEAWQELREAGVDPEKTVAPFFTAALNSALDVAPMVGILKYSFKGLKPEMAKDLIRQANKTYGQKGLWAEVFKGLGKGAAVGVAAEGPTEAAQEFINMVARSYHDPSFDLYGEEAIARLKEAFAAGSVVGAGLGGGGRASTSAVGYLREWLNQQPEEVRRHIIEGGALGVSGAENLSENFQFGRPQAVAPAPEPQTAAPALAPEPQTAAPALAPEPQTAAPAPAPEPQTAAPAPAPVPQTVPEPASDVVAQINELITSSEPGRLRYFEAESLRGVKLPGGVATAHSQDGGIYVFRKGDAQARQKIRNIERLQNRDAARGAALGYQQSKEQAVASGAPTVVQGRDAQGNVVHEEVVSPEKTAAAAATAQARGAQTVEQKSPEEVVEERQAESTIEEQEAQVRDMLGTEDGDEPTAHVASGETLEVADQIYVPGAEKVQRDVRLAVRRVLEAIAGEGQLIDEPVITPRSSGVDYTLSLPPEISRNPDITPATIKALVRAAAVGQAKRKDRITLRVPKVRGEGTTQMYFNLPELATFGRLLNEQAYGDAVESGANARDNVLSALAWLIDHGWTVPQNAKGEPAIDEKASVLKFTGMTWKQVKNARRVYESKHAKAIDEMDIDQLREREAELEAGLDELYRTNSRGTPKEIRKRSYQILSLRSQLDRVQRRIAEIEAEEEMGYVSAIDAMENDWTSYRLESERDQMLRSTGYMAFQPVNNRIKFETHVELGDLGEGSAEIGTAVLEGIRPGEVKVVEGSTTKALEGEAKAVKTILDEVGVQLVSGVQLVDDAGLETLLGNRDEDVLPPPPSDTTEDNAQTRQAMRTHREEVTRRLQALVDEWLAPLGLGEGVRVKESPMPSRANGRYDATTGTIWLNEEHVDRFGQARNRREQLFVLEVLAHEVGHAVDELIIKTAPKGQRDALEKAYQRWRHEHKNEHAADVRIARHTPLRQARTKKIVGKANAEGRPLPPAHGREYALRRNEWFADQVARYLLDGTIESDSPALRQLVRNAAKLFRRLYRAIAKTLGVTATTDKAVADYLNRVKQNIAEINGEQSTGPAPYPEGDSVAFNFSEPAPEQPKAQPKKAALKKAESFEERNRRIIEQVRKDKPSARVLFLKDANGNLRPVIYLKSSTRSAARSRRLLHEIGHVVLRHTMETTPDETIGALHEVLGGQDFTTFEENFANAFLSWAERAAIDQGFSDASPTMREAVKTFFTKLWDQLRKLWNSGRKNLKVDENFRQFMEALVNRKRPEKLERMARTNPYAKQIFDHGIVQTGFLKPRPYAAEYLDFTPVDTVKRGARRAASNAKVQHLLGAASKTKETVLAFHDRYLRGFASWLEHHGLSDLARQFQPKAGSTDNRRGGTVFIEIRRKEGSFYRSLRPLMDKWAPEVSFLDALRQREPRYTPEQEEFRRILLNEEDPKGHPGVLEVRKILDQVFEMLNKSGVPVLKRKNYFPVQYSQSKLRQAGREQFINDVFAWAEAHPEEARTLLKDIGRNQVLSRIRNKDARAKLKARWQQQDEEARRYGKTEEELDQEELERKLRNYATALFNLWAVGESTMMEGENAFEVLSPGFGAQYGRILPKSLVRALSQYREDDVFEVLVRYIRSAVKRAEWQRRFGLNNEIAEIDQRLRNARTKKAVEAAIAFKEQRMLYYYDNFGVDLYDPAARLLVDIAKKVRSGELTDDEADFVIKKIIPAFQGQLGADQHPAWRRLQAALIVYQNWRVLSTGVFAQFIDTGLLFSRAEGVRSEALKAAFKMAFDKRTRREALDLAHTIGAIRDDFTDHILNDEAGVMMLDVRLRRMNEALFKINGMHALTSWTRAWALIVGKRFIEHVYRQGDTTQLKALGLTEQDVRKWIADGMPIINKLDDPHAVVINALNQFIDESVLRPSPGNRPEMGNDQRYAIFWHLKSFPWEFTYTVLGRVYEEAKRKWGEEEGLRRLYAALPMVALAAFTIPLAALGMEARWLLSPPKQRPEGGFDYAFELLQRSGLTGMAQLLNDMDQAAEYHRFALLAPLGPTVSQLEEFWGKGMDYPIEKALPASAVIRGVRHWWTELDSSP